MRESAISFLLSRIAPHHVALPQADVDIAAKKQSGLAASSDMMQGTNNSAGNHPKIPGA
jgi:hypothetical protein